MKQHYRGGCQCGKLCATRSTLELDEVDHLQLLTLQQARIAARVHAGTRISSCNPARTRLTIYKFNKHVIDHEFCSTCGIQSFAPARRRTARR